MTSGANKQVRERDGQTDTKMLRMEKHRGFAQATEDSVLKTTQFVQHTVVTNGLHKFGKFKAPVNPPDYALGA